jgi:hypothetical protein
MRTEQPSPGVGARPVKDGVRGPSDASKFWLEGSLRKMIVKFNSISFFYDSAYDLESMMSLWDIDLTKAKEIRKKVIRERELSSDKKAIKALQRREKILTYIISYIEGQEPSYKKINSSWKFCGFPKEYHNLIRYELNYLDSLNFVND